jgi:polyhydroxyalkanoate synthesis regulator phasin
MCVLEGLDRSPMEDASLRIERLEREVAALKKRRG